MIILLFYGCTNTAASVDRTSSTLSTPEITPDFVVEITEYTPVEIPTAYYQDIADSITDEEIELLAKLTYLEARGESLLGQRAVIEVVFERVRDEQFPNTIEKVIYQKNQFSPAKFIVDTTATEEQYLAVEMVLTELYPVLDKGVVFFSRKAYNEHIYTEIGAHVFCYSDKNAPTQ